LLPLLRRRRRGFGAYNIQRAGYWPAVAASILCNVGLRRGVDVVDATHSPRLSVTQMERGSPRVGEMKHHRKRLLAATGGGDDVVRWRWQGRYDEQRCDDQGGDRREPGVSAAAGAVGDVEFELEAPGRQP
jgi:hypothetical protein